MTENEFVIDGLPQDTVNVISFAALLPRQTRDLSSVTAHRLDLRFAKTFLDLISGADDAARTALWRGAITHYCKCFSQTNKTGGRRPLNSKLLPAGLPGEIHSWFMSLRNKNLVHDENAWLQTLAGAAIAGPGKGHNIEEVICSTVEGQFLSPENFGNLTLLIEHALEWTNSEFERLCKEISEELEKVPRETLLSQPNVQYRAPEAGDVHSPRAPK